MRYLPDHFPSDRIEEANKEIEKYHTLFAIQERMIRKYEKQKINPLPETIQPLSITSGSLQKSLPVTRVVSGGSDFLSHTAYQLLLTIRNLANLKSPDEQQAFFGAIKEMGTLPHREFLLCFEALLTKLPSIKDLDHLCVDHPQEMFDIFLTFFIRLNTPQYADVEPQLLSLLKAMTAYGLYSSYNACTGGPKLPIGLFYPVRFTLDENQLFCYVRTTIPCFISLLKEIANLIEQQKDSIDIPTKDNIDEMNWLSGNFYPITKFASTIREWLQRPEQQSLNGSSSLSRKSLHKFYLEAVACEGVFLLEKL